MPTRTTTSEVPVPVERTQQVAHGPAYLFGRPLGQILVHSMGLTEEKLAEALAAQADKGGRLGEVLVGMKAVTEEDVVRALAAQLDLEYVASISADDVEPELIARMPINFAKQNKLLPLKVESDQIVVVVSDSRLRPRSGGPSHGGV